MQELSEDLASTARRGSRKWRAKGSIACLRRCVCVVVPAGVPICAWKIIAKVEAHPEQTFDGIK
eukprot:5375329-Alexandrium_andersonii.AAC.1